MQCQICMTLSIFLRRSETGEYLALDLGGTNFRVLLVTLKDGRMVKEVFSNCLCQVSIKILICS